MPELQQILDAINTGANITVLVAIIIMFLKGYIIPRSIYEELVKRLSEEVTKEIMDGVREIIKEYINK